jgi:hypothetical protein
MLQFGVIVLTTANGILDHEEARRKKVGGKVLGRGYTSRTSLVLSHFTKLTLPLRNQHLRGPYDLVSSTDLKYASCSSRNKSEPMKS